MYIYNRNYRGDSFVVALILCEISPKVNKICPKGWLCLRMQLLILNRRVDNKLPSALNSVIKCCSCSTNSDSVFMENKKLLSLKLFDTDTG